MPSSTSAVRRSRNARNSGEFVRNSGAPISNGPGGDPQLVGDRFSSVTSCEAADEFEVVGGKAALSGLNEDVSQFEEVVVVVNRRFAFDGFTTKSMQPVFSLLNKTLVHVFPPSVVRKTPFSLFGPQAWPIDATKTISGFSG